MSGDFPSDQAAGFDVAQENAVSAQSITLALDPLIDHTFRPSFGPFHRDNRFLTRRYRHRYRTFRRLYCSFGIVRRQLVQFHDFVLHPLRREFAGVQPYDDLVPVVALELNLYLEWGSAAAIIQSGLIHIRHRFGYLFACFIDQVFDSELYFRFACSEQ